MRVETVLLFFSGLTVPRRDISTRFKSFVFIVYLKGEKDWQKYETARRLKKCVDRIRNQYREDWKSKEMRIRQRAVALYFIDKVRCMVTAYLFIFYFFCH